MIKKIKNFFVKVGNFFKDVWQTDGMKRALVIGVVAYIAFVIVLRMFGLTKFAWGFFCGAGFTALLVIWYTIYLHNN